MAWAQRILRAFMFRRFCAAFAVLACGCGLAGAVSPRYSGAPVAQVFTERDIPGSPQTRVVLIHPNGLVYVGNVRGLFEYDGESWKNIAGTRGLIVHNLGADAAGRIWYSGMNVFGSVAPDAQGTLTARPLHTQLPPEEREVGHVLRMLVHRGEAYFVTQGAKSFIAHATADGRVGQIFPPAGQRVATLFVRDDVVHVITTTAVYRLVDGKLVAAPLAQALTRLGVQSVWPGGEGAAWVVSALGLRRWREDQAPLVSDEVATLLGEDRVACGCPVGDGRFALGTERHGVLMVEAESGRVLAQYDEDGGLGATSSTIAAMTLDPAGGLWLSRFAGVTRVQVETPAAKHDGANGVRGRVQAFGFWRDRLHVATTHGVFVREPESGRFAVVPGTLGDVWALLPTEDGLIVGGPDLRLLREDGRVEVIERERLLFRAVLRLRRDPERLLATTGPGQMRIYRREQGGWRFEAAVSGAPAGLYPLVEDRSGRIWATRNRTDLMRLDWRDGLRREARWEPVSMPGVQGGAGRLQLFLLDGWPQVSSEKGLWRYDAAADRLLPETRIEGIDTARWSKVWPMGDGALWFASNNPGDPSAVALRQGPESWRLSPQRYSGLESILPLEVAHDAATSTIWIGHLGLASVDLNWTGERAPPPMARLRSIATTGGRLLWGGSGLPFTAPLAAENNSLVFEFAALALQPTAFGETAVHYRTKLEGFDSEWSPWSATNQRTYANLPPKQLSFLVQARDATSREGAITRFDFVLLPPWWRTWWWITLEAIAGIAAIASLTRWVTQRALQRRVALLEAQSVLERERLRLARDLHDEVGSGLGRVILFNSEAQRTRQDPAQLEANLARVQDSAQELMQHAREIVWAVSPQHDTLASLVERIGSYVDQTLHAAGVACRIELPPPGDIPSVPLASEARHSLFLALKEAVHNCVKYSGAKTAELRIALEPNQLTIMLRDFGRGFVPGARRGAGHGLGNIVARAEALSGTAEIVSGVGQGTTITLRVPLPAAGK